MLLRVTQMQQHRVTKFGILLVQWNPDLQPPRYNGHFFWPPSKNDHTFSCKETLVSKVTSLLRPIFLAHY